MPDRIDRDDWGALAYRVRVLEDRTEEDRRAMAAMIASTRSDLEHASSSIRSELDHAYLTADRTAVLYPSRKELAQLGKGRREWLLALVGVLAALASVLQIVAMAKGR